MAGSYRELERRWRALRDRRVRVSELRCADDTRTLLYVESGNQQQPAITIAAGVHGDEPVGPWALLELAESGELFARDELAYRVWPCTNPTGYARGTRRSTEGIDINRTFTLRGQSLEARAILSANRNRNFALSIDLHEDCDATGFYCYAYHPDESQQGGRKNIADEVIRAIDAASLPVQRFDGDFDFGEVPAHAVRLAHGIIYPNPIAETKAIGGLSYSLAMCRRKTPHVLTFETPSRLSWETRLAMHQTAIVAALKSVMVDLTRFRGQVVK